MNKNCMVLVMGAALVLGACVSTVEVRGGASGARASTGGGTVEVRGGASEARMITGVDVMVESGMALATTGGGVTLVEPDPEAETPEADEAETPEVETPEVDEAETPKVETTEVDKADAALVAQATTQRYDRHRDVTTVEGPAIRDWSVITSGDDSELVDTAWFLRMLKREGDSPFQLYQIYIQIEIGRRGEWLFADRAYRQGEQLSVTQISREVGNCRPPFGGCLLFEDIAINLSLRDLQSIANSGSVFYSFAVYGSGGSVPMLIPTTYFEGFLEYLYAKGHVERPEGEQAA